jgi:RNA polymerase sigma factor (sigma-70 family)
MIDGYGSDSTLRAALLAHPDLRAALERYARRRVARDEVADLVQSTLVEALAADNTPPELEALRRYVFVVARNKVIDLRRRRATEAAAVAAVESATHDHDEVAVRELMQWLTRQVSRDEERATLEWMLREAEGHRLEHIAREAALPPPRVRKRVSRLRRLLRARWARYAGGGVLLLLLALGVLRGAGPEARLQSRVTPKQRARSLRDTALERCANAEHRPCLDALERARQLDPAGDAAATVQRARRDAERALLPEPPRLEPAPPADSARPLPTSRAPRSTSPAPLMTTDVK